MREGIRCRLTRRNNMEMELVTGNGNEIELRSRGQLRTETELNLSVSFSFLQSDDRFAMTNWAGGGREGNPWSNYQCCARPQQLVLPLSPSLPLSLSLSLFLSISLFRSSSVLLLSFQCRDRIPRFARFLPQTQLDSHLTAATASWFLRSTCLSGRRLQFSSLCLPRSPLRHSSRNPFWFTLVIRSALKPKTQLI